MANIPVLPTFVDGQPLRAADLNALRDGIQFVTTQQPHMFARQALNVTQNVPSATWTTITYDTVDIDTDGGMSAQGAYTVQTAGWWRATANLCWATANSNQTPVADRAVRFQINNLTVTGICAAPASGIINGLMLTRLIYLNVGDVLIVQGFQNTGSALSTSLNYNAGAAESTIFSLEYFKAVF